METRHTRYNRSAKGKARSKRYDQTPKGASRKRAYRTEGLAGYVVEQRGRLRRRRAAIAKLLEELNGTHTEDA